VAISVISGCPSTSPGLDASSVAGLAGGLAAAGIVLFACVYRCLIIPHHFVPGTLVLKPSQAGEAMDKAETARAPPPPTPALQPDDPYAVPDLSAPAFGGGGAGVGAATLRATTSIRSPQANPMASPPPSTATTQHPATSRTVLKSVPPSIFRMCVAWYPSLSPAYFSRVTEHILFCSIPCIRMLTHMHTTSHLSFAGLRAKGRYPLLGRFSTQWS